MMKDDPIFQPYIIILNGDCSREQVEQLSKGLKASGLNKREYFAAMALQGIIAAGKPLRLDGKVRSLEESAVRIADALIRELGKSND